MASVDRNTSNGLAKMTDVNAGGHSELDPFDGVFVFGMDAFPAFAMVSQSAMKNQTIDGGYGRAFNAGRGLVGEGGDTGPGVVGIAGNVIARPFKDTLFPTSSLAAIARANVPQPPASSLRSTFGDRPFLIAV